MKIISKTSGLDLRQHLADTAKVIEHLWHNYLAPINQKRLPLDLCIYVAKVHDIGKATENFQRNFPDLTECPISTNNKSVNNEWWGHHTYLGSVILAEKNIPKDICEVVALHHGFARMSKLPMRAQDTVKVLLGTYNNNDIYNKMWDELLNIPLPSKIILSAVEKTILAGLLSMADWIASNEEYPVDKWLEDNKNVIQWQPNKNTFQDNFDFEPRALQQDILNNIDCKKAGLIIYEATMGSGKTEVSLQLAQQLAYEQGYVGVALGLPTRSTTNAMYKRFSRWAKKQNQSMSIQLGNRDKELVKEYKDLKIDKPVEFDIDKLYVDPFYDKLYLELGSTMYCGTVDHIIKSAYAHKYITIEQFILSQKVVVIDEVHSYDEYMMQYLCRELSWLGAMSTPVIILSATLNGNSRNRLIESYLQGKKHEDLTQGYPRVTYTLKDVNEVVEYIPNYTEEQKKITVKTITDLDYAEVILENTLNKGLCVGIIVNTADLAQKLYMKYNNKYKTTLLHSRFVSPHRRKKEEWLEHTLGKNSTDDDRKGVLFIATQVAEMSLDIDLDVLITEVAPVDRLLQRVGRLQRHQRNRNIEPVVYVSEDLRLRSVEKIYPAYLMNKTLDILKDTLYITLPKDIPYLVEKCYKSDNTKEYQEYQMLLTKDKKKAEPYLLKKPLRRSKQNFSIISLFQAVSKEYHVRDGLEVSVNLFNEDGVLLGDINAPMKMRKALNDVCLDLKPSSDKIYYIGNQKWKYDEEVGLYEVF